jgi:hypothetical protein
MQNTGVNPGFNDTRDSLFSSIKKREDPEALSVSTDKNEI